METRDTADLEVCATAAAPPAGFFRQALSEYYLRTVADGLPDASVLHGIEEYTVNLAKGQSKYGTFGHGGAEQHADGSLHGSTMKISAVAKQFSLGLAACVAFLTGSARADTTISAGGTFTIDDANTTLSGTTRTWNDTGTLTIFNGAVLQT